MTKERLRRLIELTYSLGFEHARWGSEAEDKGELFELQTEFEAWEPEAERDEARYVAREILDELGYPARIKQLQHEHPWLKEN